MYQLKTKQICLFAIAILPITKFFIMNSIIVEYASNDMWISVLINLFLDYVAVFSVLYFYKKTNTSFLDFIQAKFGKTVKNIITVLFILYFFTKAIIPTFEQKEYILSTLYITIPKFYYFLPFFFASCYLCSQKTRAVGRVSELLWFMTIFGYAMLVTLSFQNADFGSIFPVNYNNTAGILKGSYSALNWFGDGAYYLFLIGEFELKEKDGGKILLSYLISCLMVFAFSFLFYCIFSSIGYRQRFAMTEVSKYSTVINNTGRFDYIGIIIILFINVFSLTLPLFFAGKLIEKLFNLKTNWISSVTVNVSALLVMIIFNDKLARLESFIITYFGFFFLVVGTVIPLVSSLLTVKGVKNEISQN